MLSLSHVSPLGMLSSGVPLCMSFRRFGTTNATVGSLENWEASVGKSRDRRFDAAAAVLPLGTFLKLIQGTCFLAYVQASPSQPGGARVPVKPMLGRPSEYPLKVSPRLISCSPRLLAANGYAGFEESGTMSENPTD